MPSTGLFASILSGKQTLVAASLHTGARSSPVLAPAGQRTMSYFSGSHYDHEHMQDAKNPHLPKVLPQTLRLRCIVQDNFRCDGFSN